jgi:alpha-glucosidase
MSSVKTSAWWQIGTVYQIYPLSFMDSNGDGIGDLPGITSRLGYCRWLGVNAVWLSPIYPSPMIDFGYDVTDYTGIHPLFGTLGDFDEMMEEAQRLGLKMLLDFVPNHTSDQHPWFIQSRAQRNSPYRDWYIWRDPAPGGGPPNNWLSVFGGAAWEWDPITEQYFLHSYLKEQPDLNWRNPEVEAAMLAAMRFWLERGVRGFRIDSISHLIKDSEFRDNPINPDYHPSRGPYHAYLPVHSVDLAECHEVIRRMRRVIDHYQDSIIIGEAYLSLERTVAYYGAGVHLPFNFALIQSPWRARDVYRAITSYEALLKPDQWPNWVLGNHDRHRIASRVGRAQARVAAMLLLTLRGTPTLYYGDEIAMEDVRIPPESAKDPWGKNVPSLGLGRDPERSPMQWNSAAQAGFSTTSPWLPIAPDALVYNVRAEREQPDSALQLYRRLIDLRARRTALQTGRYRNLWCDDRVLSYSRSVENDSLLIVLNLSDQPAQFETSALRRSIRLSTHLDREGEEVRSRTSLRANEGLILDGG